MYGVCKSSINVVGMIGKRYTGRARAREQVVMLASNSVIAAM